MLYVYISPAGVNEFRDVFTEFFGAPPDAFEFGSPRAGNFFGNSAFEFSGTGLSGNRFASGLSQRTSWGQNAGIEAPLTLTLEELYTGRSKRLALTRRITDAASGQSVHVREEVTIQVQAGWQEGQRYAHPISRKALGKVLYLKCGDITPAFISVLDPFPTKTGFN